MDDRDRDKGFLPIFLGGCLIPILIPIIIIALIILNNTFSIPSFPRGELLFTSNSPHNAYILEIYRMNGGATTSYAIRGEIIDRKTGVRKKIYYQYRAGDAIVSWVNEHTVMINGKTLDVRKDIYDSRKEDS